MKAIWLTDIHLNFLKQKELDAFHDHVCQKIDEHNADYIFLTGDIAEAKCFEKHIVDMDSTLAAACRILFVLGNHDYYQGSVKEVRMQAIKMDGPIYLNYSNVILHPKEEGEGKVMICGVDGFADARYGNAYKSTILMNDHVLIRELKLAGMAGGKTGLLKKMEELADGDAQRLDAILNKKPDYVKDVVILTHIPPFPEVSKYQGKIAGEEFLPYYTSKATGDILMKHAKANPSIQYLVLCGHSHHEAHFQPLPNLNVYCGKATYGSPHVQEMVIEL